MIQRHFWQKLVGTSLQERTVIWLAGVRRVGKFPKLHVIATGSSTLGLVIHQNIW